MVRFLTNIDCCKRFMRNIEGFSAKEINPMIDDIVIVNSTKPMEVTMRVVERYWDISDGKVILNVYLAEPIGWPRTNFIATITERFGL